MRAKTVTFVGPRRVNVDTVDVAEPQEGEVLVRTVVSGISSGTEMLAYRGEIDSTLPLDERLGALSGTFAYPFHYGYACVGIVERSRAALRPGTLVFAYHPHQEALVSPASDLVALEGVDARCATLLPHVETALQISLDAGAVQHSCVAVVGLGAVGILTASLLARAGAEVVGIEPAPWRREAAGRFAIEAVAPAGAEAAVRERTQGAGASLVVEVSGNPSALDRALRLLAHEGTALVASWYGTKRVELELGGVFHRRRLHLASSQVSSIPARLQGAWTIERRRAAAASLLGRLPMSVLATHEWTVEEAAAAFEAVDEAREGLIHAALRFATR
jgi:2-desacetyl-2-hydroxyethyl bacteriochlorophyllide A dehydrogenase